MALAHEDDMMPFPLRRGVLFEISWPNFVPLKQKSFSLGFSEVCADQARGAA